MEDMICLSFLFSANTVFQQIVHQLSNSKCWLLALFLIALFFVSIFFSASLVRHLPHWCSSQCIGRMCLPNVPRQSAGCWQKLCGLLAKIGKVNGFSFSCFRWFLLSAKCPTRSCKPETAESCKWRNQFAEF